MWSDIVLERDPVGSITDSVRADLVSRSEAEVAAAVAWVDAHENLVAELATDRSRDAEARTSFREAQRVRELLRIRAYSIETELTWETLDAADRRLLLDRAERAGFGRDPRVTQAAIGTVLNQLVVGRLIALATDTKGSVASPGEAMIALPIAFQLEVIRETGRDLRIPGELMRNLAIAASASA